MPRGPTTVLTHASRSPTKPCSTLSMAIFDTSVAQQTSRDQTPVAAQNSKPNCPNGWKPSMILICQQHRNFGFINIFVVSKLAWPFTSLDFSLTFVQQLEAVAARFLKRWSGLPQPANTAILHLGSSNRASLHIEQLSTFWKQMPSVRMDILKNAIISPFSGACLCCHRS